eukprot:jgi/Picre1/33670/NNA_001149.t1
MSIFKKRTLRPNQLASLRKLEEEKVKSGKVTLVQGKIAVIEGLDNDSESGTELQFSSGPSGVLLWRRDDNVVFGLVPEGSNMVSVGDQVDCQVTGILQVADEEEGPRTKREYTYAKVPVGEELLGQVVDFKGCVVEDGSDAPCGNPIGTSIMYPLLNPPPNMEDRESIDSPLTTGVKAIDIITPLGKGQALQVSGVEGSGKTQLCIQAIIGQRDTGVRCVYAAIGCTKKQFNQTLKALKEYGCMEYTTVVVATADADLGEQYAAICYACSIAERFRDEGKDSLVVLNSISAMVKLWESITYSMATLGSVQIEASEMEDSDSDLVEYEGMLVSVAAAQRRRFFGSLIQRCARMHKRLKGGSMTGLFVVPGSPALGRKPQMKDKIAAYKHLTPAQKEKLLHALEQQGEADSSIVSANDLKTEVVEEFMSMADGQVVLENSRDEVTGGPRVDPRLSVSRIGSRAHSPAISDLASLVRFELAQANDAQRFAANAASDPLARKALQRADAVTAALPQREGSICTLEQQVIQLLAIHQGLLDNVPLEDVTSTLDEITDDVTKRCPVGVEEIKATKKLSQAAKAAILAALTTR